MALKFQDYRDELLFVPLGGANEIGMNLNLYHYQGKWLMVDCGVGFASGDWLPGVDVMVPDMEFLRDKKHDVVGLVLTHAHEDHLGALPYVWDEIACPIYATAFTAAFLRAKLMGEGAHGKLDIREVSLGGQVSIGPFSVEMIGLTHSIPEMQALAISTAKGTIMHTGDWKLDEAPMVGNVSDTASLSRYGDAGVLAMVCDSTNVFVEGSSGSEETVRKNLTERIMSVTEGRVAVTTFASNVARLETILYAANEAGRKVILAGRSLWRILESAREAGYLREFEVHPETMSGTIPASQQLIVCTGSQGEPLSALPKIARGDHPNIRLVPKDTVIFSSRVIPGNEQRIHYLQNMLLRKGIEVITDRDDEIHVSGHPARDELAEMYRYVRPRIAVPVHGEARHIHEHAKFAKSLQVPHAVEPYNGAVVQLSGDVPKIIGEVTSGYVAIDGNVLMDVDSPVLRARRKIRDAGVVCVVLVVDDGMTLAATPVIQAPGSLDPELDADLLSALSEEVEAMMERTRKGQPMAALKQEVRATVRRFYKQEVGKKPMIEVEFVRV